MKYLQFLWLGREISFPINDIAIIEYNQEKKHLHLTMRHDGSFNFHKEHAESIYKIIKSKLDVVDSGAEGSPGYTNRT
jgi:hypothetical protein